MIIIINPHETIKQNAGDIRKDKNELKRVVNNLIDEGKIDVRSSPTEAMLAEDIICTMNNIEEMICEKMNGFTNDEKEELINNIHDIIQIEEINKTIQFVIYFFLKFVNFITILRKIKSYNLCIS